MGVMVHPEMASEKSYQVLLYYKFHPIENPSQFTKEHKEFCEKRNLVGRILIGAEGINGTCTGLPKDIEAYKDYVHSLKGFEDMWFKEHIVSELPLKNLRIKCRKEIVSLGAEVDMGKTAEYLSPEEFHSMVELSFHDDSIVILDGRNQIEARIGKFRNAVVPQVRFFRELKDEIKKENYVPLKEKKILMYCTGGIRCEKASAMLKEEGFKDVYQLHGGIYNYLKTYPNGYFDGTCFVFDDRMQVVFKEGGEVINGSAAPEEKIISHCDFCQSKSNRVVNDERKERRFLVICCDECDRQHDVSRIRYGKERKDEALLNSVF